MSRTTKLEPDLIETASADAFRRDEQPIVDPPALRTLFLLSSMPVGGAETLLVNLIRGFDRAKIVPEIGCLKDPGPLGEVIAKEVPLHSRLIRSKFDAGVILRLQRLMRSRQIDAVVTVGAGDKMFWGRIAAKLARVPVIASALHSTGWPDGVGGLNRLLTPLTDAFIGVARDHARHLVEGERFPAEKVHVIPNGVDTERFVPAADRGGLRQQLGLEPTACYVSLVAALRPEKNHQRFLRIAQTVLKRLPDTRFLLIGDGPARPDLENTAASLGIDHAVRFFGNRYDTPELLAASDLFLLTSDNEASPVSIMEAMSCELPVVTSDVGSIHELVEQGVGGFRVRPSEEQLFVDAVCDLVENPTWRREMGRRARQIVQQRGSLRTMISGYEQLLRQIYQAKQYAGLSELPMTRSAHS